MRGRKKEVGQLGGGNQASSTGHMLKGGTRWVFLFAEGSIVWVGHRGLRSDREKNRR